MTQLSLFTTPPNIDQIPLRIQIQQTLYALRRRIVSLKPILETTLETVKNLGMVEDKIAKMADVLGCMR